MRRWMRQLSDCADLRGHLFLNASPLPEASPMARPPVEGLQTGQATPPAAHIASLTVGGKDRVDLNIAPPNSHDGISAFRILVTPVPVVCANTQSAALSNHESSFSIRHTRNANSAVQTAREAGTDLHLRRRVPGRGRAAEPAEHHRRRVRRAGRRHFGETQAEATKRIRESERRRRSRLHWLFAYADTQASIRDRRVHDCRALIYSRSGHRRRRLAPRAGALQVRQGGSRHFRLSFRGLNLVGSKATGAATGPCSMRSATMAPVAAPRLSPSML